MALLVMRLLFILTLVGVGQALSTDATKLPYFIGAFGLSIVIIGVDVLVRRKSVAVLSAIFFGLLAGLVMALLFGAVIRITTWIPQDLVVPLTIFLTVILSYAAISLIMQTKDDFRFIIPYIEFARESKGSRPVVLDTSVIIDGRIADLCETGLFDAELVVPRFVLQELQTIADSGDKLKRNRGRRGLDMLNRLQSSEKVEIRIHDRGAGAVAAQGQDVDAQLVTLAQELNGRIITTDYNLNKVSQFRGVAVININDLGNALKPVVLPGEPMKVTLVKAGEEPGQGVGYLEDGTMVVVEGGRDFVGQEVTMTVTSALQTSAGRMIFGKMEGAGGSRGKPRARPSGPDESPKGGGEK